MHKSPIKLVQKVFIYKKPQIRYRNAQKIKNFTNFYNKVKIIRKN